MKEGRQVIDNNELLRRRKRVNHLKKIIIITMVVLLILPTVCCIFLFIKMNSLEKQIAVLRVMYNDEYNKADKQLKKDSEDTNIAYAADITGDRQEKKEFISGKKTQESSGKKVYLTFDDGPSKYTQDILNILDEYNIKATFFVIGKTDQYSKKMYQEIVNKGHTLGMHSYSHQYKTLYNSLQSFKDDYEKISSLLYKTTGVWPKYYRFPGGSSNKVSNMDMSVFIKFLKKEHIVYYDWNVMNGDAVSKELSKDVLVSNVMSEIKKHETSVVLMHDISTKANTVKALPVIIEKLQKEGYDFFPIDEYTTPVQHIKADSIK